MTNETRQDWLTIPDFPDYRINRRTYEVQSKKRYNKWIPLRDGSTDGRVDLWDSKAKKRHTINLKRLCYCALKGINPFSMPSNIYVVETGNGLELCDMRQITERTLKSRPKQSAENIERKYEHALREINMILKAYETDDFAPIVEEIWGYEDRISTYLRANHFACTKDKILEIWMQVSEITLNAIKDRKGTVFSIYGHLRRTARIIVALERKVKKQILNEEITSKHPFILRTEDPNLQPITQQQIP